MSSNSKHRTSTGFFWAWVDVLTCLLLVVYVLIAPPVQHKQASIPTEGVYAVTIDWSAAKTDDVDLWVMDPARNIAYYENQQVGLMNLEHDDTGTDSSEALIWSGHSYRSVGDNHERTVIRQTIPGEYAVNIYMYRKDSDGPVPVRVTLWYLADAKVSMQRVITLTNQNQEVTAFRFTVNAKGYITAHNQLPECISCAATGGHL